jgi:Arc/MetJ-type ribon-helix-helix transcriptional regulator
VDEALLRELDGLVAANRYENRSVAVESAIALLRRQELDAQFERALGAMTPEDVSEMQALAEEGMEEWSRHILETTEWDEREWQEGEALEVVGSA